MTDPTTGTGAPKDGGDAAKQPTTGTPGATDRNASEDKDARIAKLEAEKAQALAEKQTHERVKAEKEALEQQVQAMSRPPATPGLDPLQQSLQAGYQNLIYKAQVLQDPDAILQLAVIQGVQDTRMLSQRQGALAGVQPDLKSDVDRLLQANPNLDVLTAERIAKGDRAERLLKEREIRETEDKARAEEAERARNPGASSVPPSPPSGKTESMKGSEFKARMASLTQRVKDGDMAARKEALALGQQVDAGTIPVDWAT